MKILLLSNKVPYPANDGSSIAIANMVDGLLKNDVEVCLFSINTIKHYKSAEDIYNTSPKNLQLHIVKANTNLGVFSAIANLISGKPYHVSRFFIKKYDAKLKALLQAHNFDVVQIEGLPMGVYLDTIKKYSKARISLRAHNVEHLIWRRHLESESNPLKRWYLSLQIKRLKKFENTITKAVDAVISITPIDKVFFDKHRSAHSNLSIPCGIDVTDYPLKSTTTIYDVVYLASFDWLPNVQGVEWFLEKVWPQVLKLKPEATFALAGRHMPTKFKHLTIKGVVTIGEVADMQSFIRSGKIVAIPLLAGSGMRIKLIENLALGKAIVSTHIGAEGTEVKHQQDIILENNPITFAKAIVGLLHNDVQRKALEIAARQTAEKYYNNKNLGQKLIAFYQAL